MNTLSIQKLKLFDQQKKKTSGFFVIWKKNSNSNKLFWSKNNQEKRSKFFLAHTVIHIIGNIMNKKYIEYFMELIYIYSMNKHKI